MKQRNISRWPRWAVMGLTLVLGACASPAPPPPQPAVPPQVIYRIDDHRYFEVTPENQCYSDMIYFVDTAKGIHSKITKFDMAMYNTTLIIDAANDQYLVAPVTRGGASCSSGGGFCSGEQMPYSTDGGRTWKRVSSRPVSENFSQLMASGSRAYHSDSINVDTTITDELDLAHLLPDPPPPQRNPWQWKFLSKKFVFKPRIAPIDTKVRCD
jgi:hypothetical protein